MGHDVLALDQNEALSRLADEDVLALAAEQERIVITHNVRDFAPIVRRWTEARRPHHGVILVALATTDYGASCVGSSRHTPSAPTRPSGSTASCSSRAGDAGTRLGQAAAWRCAQRRAASCSSSAAMWA